MVITETKRLALRELEETDIDALMRVWGDHVVMKRCGGAADAQTIGQVIGINRENYRTHGYAVFAVVQKADSELIGAVGCKPDENNPHRAELIYHFVQKVWGQGFASEAAEAFLHWVEGTRRLDYISASALPDNAASIRILEKNGFIQNGTVQFEDTGFVPEPLYERHL